MFKQNNKLMETTILNYADSIYKNSFSIPAFQREYRWGSQKKKIIDLLDSIYRGFNIGAVIFWDSKIKGLSRKDHNLYHINELSKISYIVDGQQRSLTLWALFGEEAPTEFLKDIRKETYIVFDEENKKLSFSFHKPRTSEWITLQYFINSILRGNEKVVDVFEEYHQNPEKYQSFFNELKTFKNIISSEKLIIGYKLNISDKDLSEAIKQFEKINSSGIKLREIDILDALAYSDKKYQLLETANSFKNTGINGVVTSEGKYSVDIKKILVNSFKLIKNYLLDEHISLSADALSNFLEGDSKILKQIIKLLKEFLSSIKKININDLKWVPYTHNITIYVFLKYFYPHYFPEEKEIDFIFTVMFQTGISKSYDKSASQKLVEHIKKIIKSFDEKKSINLFVENFMITHQDIKMTNYSRMKSMEKAILLYWAHVLKPIDYESKQNVTFDGLFKKSKNLDHIFPRSKYKNNSWVDCLANIQIIEAKTNKLKGDSLPSAYFSGIPFKDNIIQYESHLIKTSNHYEYLIDDEMDPFIMDRSELIADDINEYINETIN